MSEYDGLVERLKAARENRAPFPFPRIDPPMSMLPRYAVRDDDLREIEAAIASLQAKLEAAETYGRRQDIQARYFNAEAGAAENEIARLRQQGVEAGNNAESVASWLEGWGAHVGKCKGGDECTCGLTMARYEAAEIARKTEQDKLDAGK